MNPQPCPSQAYVYNGRVLRVIDGDTLDVALDLGLLLSTTQRLRLVDVNAPEMHGPSRPSGLAARDYARGRLEGRDVVIRTSRSDAFGRWLARVWVADDGAGTPGTAVDFNHELVARGFAVPFLEGTGGV
ncbi:thermonuclease family protein [Tundrisphaera sp. TA3]|uniref:thermonuclease family protein n=1 Tax=Tundrisphaera sp. TA3 TaxID=3435775 RepID=UPI003EBCF648